MCAETCRIARTHSYGRHENYWSGLTYRRTTLPPLLCWIHVNVRSTLNTVTQGVSFNLNHLAFNACMHHGFLKRNEICCTEVPDDAHGQSNKGHARVRAFYSILPYPSSTPFTRCTPCSTNLWPFSASLLSSSNSSKRHRPLAPDHLKVRCSRTQQKAHFFLRRRSHVHSNGSGLTPVPLMLLRI